MIGAVFVTLVCFTCLSFHPIREFFNQITCNIYCVMGLYYCHLQRPVTVTPIDQRLAVEMSLPVLTT